MSKNKCTTRVVIGGDLAGIPPVSAAIEDMMRECRFSDEEILDLQLGVEEAIANIILHGYRSVSGEVEIEIDVTGKAAEVSISDQAPPFDPLSVPVPDLGAELSERHAGGLGIHLMRQVVDEVRYEYVNGKNVLKLVKRKTN
jgi:serine/threonine-protein kinase RsbW